MFALLSVLACVISQQGTVLERLEAFCTVELFDSVEFGAHHHQAAAYDCLEEEVVDVRVVLIIKHVVEDVFLSVLQIGAFRGKHE